MTTSDFMVHHIVGGNVVLDKKARSAIIEVTLADEAGRTLKIKAPYGQLDGISQCFLTLAHQALNFATKNGFVPSNDHNQPAAFAPDAVRAIPNYLQHNATVQFIGRLAPETPITMGSVLLSNELLVATIGQLQHAATIIRDFGHLSGDGKQTWDIQLGPPINLGKFKRGATSEPIPPEVAPFLAQIGVLWGRYDRDLNDFVAALLKRCPDPEYSNPNLLGFEKRNLKMRDKTATLFSGNPELISFFTKMFQDGANIAGKRNVLLHGRITAVVKIKPDKLYGISRANIAIEAIGTHKGKERKMFFTNDKIEELFLDMADLALRMQDVLNVDDSLSSLLPSEDISILRDLLRNGNQNPSNVPTEQSPPQSSQA
jgi:hypothetical protein